MRGSLDYHGPFANELPFLVVAALIVWLAWTWYDTRGARRSRRL